MESNTMRFLLVLLLALTPAAAAVSDSKPRDYASQLDKANMEFLRDLAEKLEATGFKHVRVVPELFVAVVERPDGKPAALVVDSNTLRTFEVGKSLDAVLNDVNQAEQTVPPSLR
jgi:hypothetical protein